MTHLVEVELDMIIMKNCVYGSTRGVKFDPKNTFKNVQHVKIQHSLTLFRLGERI